MGCTIGKFIIKNEIGVNEWLAFFMQDPCRHGVKDAVELCTRAGVKVVPFSFSVFSIRLIFRFAIEIFL